MKKKIVISANSSWNIKNFRLSLIEELKENYDLFILAPFDNYTEKFVDENVKFFDLKINKRGINFIQEILLIINYFKILYSIKPDLYIGYTIKPNIYGNIVCSFLKIKSISNITGLGSVFISKSFFTSIIRIIYKISLKFSNKVIFQNISDLNYFVNNKIISYKKSMLISGSGVDTIKFNYNKNLIGKKIKFLYAGRILHEKGIFELIDSIKYIKKKYVNTEFTIIGSYENNRINLIKNSHVQNWKKSKLFNFLDHKDNIINDIKNCNCVILPSYREGLPMFLLEAISIGRPVLTSNVPGCRDIVTDGYNGFLFESKNTLDLIDKIIKFINLDQEKVIEMGIKGRKLAEKKFDKGIINSQFSKLIYKLIN